MMRYRYTRWWIHGLTQSRRQAAVPHKQMGAVHVLRGSRRPDFLLMNVQVPIRRIAHL
jgi:hypothetical protein